MNLLLFSNIRGPDTYIPLNLLSIATCAQHLGHNVKVIDGQIDRDWQDTFLKEAARADLIGVSSYTGPSIHAVLQAITSLKQHNLNRPVIWGGYHGTLAQARLIEEGYADIVVQGYGERAIAGILAYYQGAGSLADVPNVIYRTPQGIVTNPFATISDMDELPPLNYEFVDIPAYYTATRKIVHYISSYGCPYACTFCAEPIHSRRKWAGRSVAQIVADLHRIQHRYSPDRISFVDPNMSSNPRKIVELTHQLKQAGGEISINCNMRARDIMMISKLMPIAELYAAGFRRIFIGVESGSNSQLEKLKKASTVEDHFEAVSMLDAVGIEVQASFIHDLPNETAQEARGTLELARRLINLKTPGSNQSHHFYMPYPGTELTEQIEARMDINIDTVRQEDWAKTSTFRASEVWRGDQERRRWVLDELSRLHAINSSVITTKELERLEEKVRMEYDYVEKFML